MTKIYFSYLSDLYPQFLAHSSRNSENFPSVESEKGVICYAKGATFRKHKG